MRSDAAPSAAMRPPLTATATFDRTPASAISLPLRARAGPAHVTTCAALTNNRSVTGVSGGRRHYVLNARKAEWRLSLAPARVVARVAVYRLVFPERGPVKISGEIGAALHVSGRIDVNGSHAGAARLGDLTAHVAWNLLDVVIGVGDDAALLFLEGEQLGDHVLEVAGARRVD